jgi:hypothetical protein
MDAKDLKAGVMGFVCSRLFVFLYPFFFLFLLFFLFFFRIIGICFTQATTSFVCIFQLELRDVKHLWQNERAESEAEVEVMCDEVRQVLHRVLTANQATGPLTEAGEGDLLTSLRALNKLCANTKGTHITTFITFLFFYYLFNLLCPQAGRRTQ